MKLLKVKYLMMVSFFISSLLVGVVPAEALCLGGQFDLMTEKLKKYDKIITKYHQEYEVSKALISAIITAESCINPNAESAKGAQGLMQLMPDTAKRFGVSDRFDPNENIKAGTQYLKFLFEYFEEDFLVAVAAYNAGEGTVDKYKGIPPYKETKQYVSNVAKLYKIYNQGGANYLIDKNAVPIFVPKLIAKSRLSPYKSQRRHRIKGQCENRTGTRLRKSTTVESGGGVWQRIYTARRGDTLLRVMQRTGVHKTKLAQMNGLSSRSRLNEGQRLLVWECRK